MDTKNLRIVIFSISTNTTNIISNDTEIASNASSIATNTSNITSNDTDIASNASNIAPIRLVSLASKLQIMILQILLL